LFNPSRLHANLLFTLLAILVPLAIMCMIQAVRNREWHPWLRAGFAITELLIIAETLLGIVLWWQGSRPAQPGVHVIYAIVAALTLPISFQMVQQRTPRQAQLTIGFVSLFLIAIILRALQTGRVS
jgi:hypothetical protein